ncbi:lipoprotein [Streptomyces sp. CMC78]|uniref:Lipoprotein n=2 Tax=Streptomyces TaxID=1883 RepID=A0AB33KJD5_9ACTN
MGTALAAAAALTSIAACSGSDSSGGSGSDKAGAVSKASPVAALKQVQQKTGGAQSAKVEGTTEMGDTMSMKQSGAIGWSDGLSGALTITYTGGTMGDALKQAGGDGSVEARYFKDEYYANMGDAMAANLGGKHWIRYSYEDLAELGGASGDVMKDQIQNSTPEQGVKALLASGDVKKVGQEDVRGVSATHYSGTVDVADLTAKNSELDAEQLAAFKEQLALAGVTTQTVDIWVDKNDLLVKKTERGEMKTGTFNSTLFYSDYGTEVPSEKPAASDTVDFKEMLKQGGTPGGTA